MLELLVTLLVLLLKFYHISRYITLQKIDGRPEMKARSSNGEFLGKQVPQSFLFDVMQHIYMPFPYSGFVLYSTKFSKYGAYYGR